MVARTLQDPAMGVEPLHSADICERPAATVVHDVELEPGNIICSRAGHIADRLASHGAAVHVLPGWTGVMPHDRLVVEYQRCDRLPEDPGEPRPPERHFLKASNLPDRSRSSRAGRRLRRFQTRRSRYGEVS